MAQKPDMVAGGDPDATDLLELGYTQSLRRRLGPFSSFAAGFSFVSILTTVFQLFAFGYGFAGTTFAWTWPLVFGGQLLVALVFAELASQYPIAGCIYQWSRRLSGELVGWMAGWAMLLGQIVSVAAAAIALQVVLPQVWSGFQLVGGSSSLGSPSGASNAVLLGAALIALTTTVNALGVKVMAIINDVGVACELAGVALIVGMLFTKAKRGPAVVLHTQGFGGHGPYIGAFLASALMAAYVMYGFDSAGELAEETHKPRRTAPRSIIRALAVSGIGGALLLVAALMAAPDLNAPQMSTVGLPYIITARLGSDFGRALLVDVAIAIAVCTLAIQTAASRMIFSMARDRVVPFSAALSRVSPKTGTPVLPSLVVGVVAASILVVNVGEAQLFTALTSVAVVIVYIAYLLVTAPALFARIGVSGGAGRPSGPERFSLGRLGVLVNGGAVVYGIAMAVNIGWPRASVYDPAGGHWYLQWFAPLFVTIAAGGGLAIHRWNLATGSASPGDGDLVRAEGPSFDSAGLLATDDA